MKPTVTNGCRVTLTFDNGPTVGVTERVLSVLAERGVRATFFIVGEDLVRDGARQLAARAVEEGHWIGNHTMTHTVRLGEAPDDVARSEIADAQAVLGELSHEDRLFRPFGRGGLLGRGVLSPAAVAELERGGYTCVLWNCIPRDWEDPDGWPRRCLADIGAREWSLVVLHDTPTGAMTQLPAFLDALEAAGVEVTQEFPDECVPVRRGIVCGPLEDFLP